MQQMQQPQTSHPVVTREQWLAARKELMQEEKQFTRQRDQLSEKRRALPWLRVERDYTFQSPDGPRTLTQLFGDKSQLLVYHLMFAPEWEAACTSCSFWAETFGSSVVHLAQRDVSFAAISRAPVAELTAYQKRMRWSFAWVSSGESPFNYDFAVSFADTELGSGKRLYNYGTQAVQKSDMPGFSAFYKDASGALFHTYSTYSRGIDMMNVTYQYLDLTAKGRDEGDRPMGWLRRHDEYER